MVFRSSLNGDTPKGDPMTHSQRFLAVAAASLLSFSASAGSISVGPTTLMADTSAKHVAVTLHNSGDASVRYQVKAVGWDQVTGQNVFSPTTDIVGAPTFVDVPPQSKRTARLMRVGALGERRYYRVLLMQLRAPNVQGVQLLVNQDLPVAFEVANAPVPQVTVQAVPKGYRLTNHGQTAARVSSIGPAGGKPWREGALGWTLPGASMTYEAQPGQRAENLSITVNGQPVTVPVGR
ncbi:molecular chaperone [Stenotrophomonas maltophilia]|nr:molecular chaperone [Stenotrophomonas maltophilia]